MEVSFPDVSFKSYTNQGMCITGGASACPGRFLAKQVVQATCAMLLTEFDIELKTSSVQRDGMRYGLGVARPRSKIPARVRRRRI